MGRNPEDLHRNLDINFSVEELENLEAHYAKIPQAKADEKEGVLRTMKDVAFAENPMDREAVGEDTKVEKLIGQFEIFSNLKENGFDNLITHRIPVTEERSAGEDSFDMMVEALKNEPASTPCIFSDQMGRGRTTLGMIIACLIKEDRPGDRHLRTDPQGHRSPELEVVHHRDQVEVRRGHRGQAGRLEAPHSQLHGAVLLPNLLCHICLGIRTWRLREKLPGLYGRAQGVENYDRGGQGQARMVQDGGRLQVGAPQGDHQLSQLQGQPGHP